jgi:hypothetical protein
MNGNVNIPLDLQVIRGNIDIMRTTTFFTDSIEGYLREHQIAAIDELCEALGNPCLRTVYRKLRALAYMSSYTHRGQYYTLPSMAAFDAQGLWEYRDVWFSRYGNLLATAQAFVERSQAGYKAAELSETLHVQCKHALSTLVHRRKLTRERKAGSYVYFAAGAAQRRQQHRHRESDRASLSLLVENPELAVEEAKAAIMLFLGTLDERQRRLYAGLESLKTGHGGDEHIAQLFGLDRHTVARGRAELLSDRSVNRGARHPGGGRPSKKNS